MVRALFACVLVGVACLLGAQVAVAQPGVTPAPGSPFATGSNPQSIALNGFGLAAVADTGSNNLAVFSLGLNGGFTPVPGSPFATGAAPSSVAFGAAVDGGDTLLAVTNRADNTLSVFAMGPDLSWIPVPGSPFPTGGVGPQSVAFQQSSPSSAFFAVANAGSNNISFFGVNANGSLSGPVLVSSGGVNPQALAFGFAPNFVPVLAVANTGSNNVSVFNFPAMTPAGPSVSTGTTPVSVAFGGGQQPFLAVANSGSNNVSVFSVSSGGALTPVSGSPFAAGTAPSSVAFGSTEPGGGGPLLAVTNRGDNNVSVFSVSSSGALTPVVGSPLALSGAGAPASVAMVAQATASGQPRLLATANSATGNMSVFTVADCTTQFNQGFNAGFNPGYKSGFNSEYRSAYRRNGSWQVGWKRGFQAARKRHASREPALAAPAVLRSTRPAAVPAAVGFDVVFNAAFNQGFNSGYKSGFNAAFNVAFRRGYKAGFAKGRRRR